MMAHFLHLSHWSWNEQDSGSGVEECSLIYSNCTEGKGFSSGSNVPTYFSLLSCSLSCLGSLLIFISYFALKGIRNVAQKIITVLAVADLFTALGYILAGWNFLANKSKNCGRFVDVCEVQSFITSWSSLSSFGWSCALALHFYLLLTVKRKSKLLTLFNWENVVFWLAPLLVLVPLLVTNQLGYSHLAVSNWCFIHYAEKRPWIAEMALVLLAGKFWEILSYFFVIIAYALTRRKFNKHLRTEAEEQPILPSGWRDEPQQSPAQEARSEARQRLHIIPLTFVLLRIWGTLQFIYSVARVKGDGCVTTTTDYTVLQILGVIQAVGDGGQGWSNALIYIFLSPTIRRQLFFYPFVRLIFYISRKLRTSQGKNGDPIHVSQRRFSKRENTHGVDGSSVQEVEGQDELVDGRDSGVEAEMTSVSSR